MFWETLTKQQKVSLSLWSNVSRCTISKSEAWSKLQGLAEINSSMPCFWALSASIQPTAQGKAHDSEEKTSVRNGQHFLSQHRKHQGCFRLLLRANYKHLQLTLSTCIVSDSLKGTWRIAGWGSIGLKLSSTRRMLPLCVHAINLGMSHSLMFCGANKFVHVRNASEEVLLDVVKCNLLNVFNRFCHSLLLNVTQVLANFETCANKKDTNMTKD